MQGFNYQRAKAAFEKEWKNREEAYRKAGMTDGQIEAMHAYDWSVFQSDRKFYRHSIDAGSFSDDTDEDEEGGSKGKPWTGGIKFSVSGDDTYRLDEIFGWLEAMDTAELVIAIRRLNPKDKRLLTLYIYNGYGQEEIADILQMKQANVSRDLKKIIKMLRKALSKADKKKS